MSKANFPKYLRERKTGEAGINAVSSVVNDDFGWIFRRVNSEHDFGIDGYIDIVTNNGDVTGQTIAVQIKTGKSFFRKETAGSYIFKGNNKHLNYYINHSIPVIIILHNEQRNQSFWAPFNILRTEPTANGWKIGIPKINRFSLSAKLEIEKLLNPKLDHRSTIERNWQINEFLKGSDAIWYAVDREDVEIGNTEHLKEFITRIRLNESLCRHFAGRIELSISGYDSDPRELFEIKEVVRWFEAADPVLKHWFYFLDSKNKGDALKTYLTCLSDAKRVSPPAKIGKKIRVEVDRKKMADLVKKNFIRMNQLMDELGIKIEENKRVSRQIFRLIRKAAKND